MAKADNIDKETLKTTVSPLTQEHLLGHETVEKNLRRLIQENRLPHALLITGPQGIGKATLGYRLSRFLCASGMGEEGVLEKDSLYLSASHPVFRRFVQRSFGDFLAVPEGEETSISEIGIEAIRHLIQFLHQTPREGSVRCVLIDEAHLMNRNAANALLKILEAPPAHVFLILVTSKENFMLPTILSRVHKIRLSPLDKKITRNILRQNLEEVTEEEINFLESFSEGSPGFGQNVHVLGGKVFYDRLISFFEGCALSPKEQVIPFDLIQVFLEKHKNDRLSTDVIYGYFLKVLGMFLGLQKNEFSSQKKMVFLMSIAERLGLWQRVQDILREALAFDLDMKQVLSCVFLEVHKAFSA
ncbi:MAG: hypothetical protein B7Y25_00755 [Alphaproteobacteria bacterium 16-39-46]|nr:MAG: hypothetical protein B7Y25_00755 [Alphaproteobacteria bacterium 16-39-46]OZA44369.1 MAG: hypothetical protein B7X84_00760 [Alphaproteobacteria bacterium 17-39-52]HQS83437.1 AAA family ATPase [Alphaproteobacteria bacterium]HQS93201.1 AAA family ATPase [Alphaproteobacteria bacterium]